MSSSPFFRRYRADFFTGLAVVLPAVISIGVLVWISATVSNITDTLLFFLPKRLTHANDGAGEVFWYYRLLAFLVAVLLIGLAGRLARNYIGRKFIQMADHALLRVPLLNKIYSTVKQVNEAFSPSNKSSFSQVVLVKFPHENSRSIGFVTGEDRFLCQPGGGKFISVFVPTTPNPTAGFLVSVLEEEVIKLDISVSDGIKYLISLGAIVPDIAHLKPAPRLQKPFP
jgi:uncharacterized membrane protein